MSAGVLLQIDVGRVPGAVLGIPGIDVAGCAVHGDEDAGFGGAARIHAGSAGLRLALRRHREEGSGLSRAEEQLAARDEVVRMIAEVSRHGLSG